MLKWLKQRATDVAAAMEARQLQARKQQELATKIEQRFPPRLLHRIPNDVGDWLNQQFPSQNRTFANDAIDGNWGRLLVSWPNPPRTESERVEREADFWRGYMKMAFKRNADDTPALAPRGEIQAFFELAEVWIFRGYYAATGEYVEASYIQLARILEEGFNYIAMNKKDRSDVISQMIMKKIDEKEQFLKHRQPEHFNKWGGWFRNGIENSFHRGFVKKDLKPTIYGEGGFAGLRDVKNLNPALQAARGARAQEFKD